MTSRARLYYMSILATAVASLAAGQLMAQNVDSGRADVARQNAQPLSALYAPEGVQGDHAVSTPNDPDLGEQEILKRVDTYQPWTISAAIPIYWTSNVALTDHHTFDDVIEAPTFGVFYEPKLTNQLYGLVDVREQQFFYDKFGGFDFGAFDIDVGLTYFIPELHNLILRAAYNYDRLTEKHTFEAFFDNHAAILNVELPFRFGRAQQLSIGTSANISVAGVPETPRRADYDVYVSYNANLTRSFSVNAVGRIVVRDYVHQDSRVDVSEILALSANYHLTKLLTASAISTFAASQSNHSIFDYEVANIGGAFSLAVKF